MLKVSIVTISFNQASFLERAMRSVLDQDYPNIEYIVVDPGSTDGSRELIAKYQSRIARAILERDDGPADGLNKGFAAATGDIYGYLNADDALLPGAIAEMVAEFERHPESDVVYAHGYKVDQDGRVISRVISDRYSLRWKILSGSSVLQQSTFFRSKGFIEVGGFNTDNSTCWDGELLVDLALAGKTFRLVNRYWSLFTIHPGGISGSGRMVVQYKKDEARLFRKLAGHDMRSSDVARMKLVRMVLNIAYPVRSFTKLMDRLHRSTRKFA